MRGIFWRVNYLRDKFQRLDCSWIMLRSTRRLAGSDSDYAVNSFKVRTEVSHPTTVPFDNVGLLLVKILVGREGLMW